MNAFSSSVTWNQRCRFVAVTTMIAAILGGCGNTNGAAAGNSPSPDTGPADVAVANDTGPGGGDGVSGGDTVGQNDVAVGDSLAVGDSPASGKDADNKDAVLDSNISDGTAMDAIDGKVTDIIPSDGSSDIKKTDSASSDVSYDIAPTAKCKLDADCKDKGFSLCLPAVCNVASGNCELKPASDSTVCTVGGICGGAGTCKQGACSAPDGCAPVACAPKAVACGDVIQIDATKMNGSAMQAYKCSTQKWDGAENVYVLSADKTTVVHVTLASTVTEVASPPMTVISMPPNAANTCATNECDAQDNDFMAGIPGGSKRIFVIETTKNAVGTYKLTFKCTLPTVCGDGQCGEGEACTSCPKDCGPCKACGDGKCDAATEDCGACPADCGACAPECVAKKAGDPNPSGCGGCGCEKCVCAMDSFCCKTAWDSSCVDECSQQCKGPECGGKAVCGNNTCDDTEDPTTCPNDCPLTPDCGDGYCVATEKCDSCSIDCGGCPGGQPSGPTCGNGKCDGAEHCGTCPADCGVCSPNCASPGLSQGSGAGCGNCDCQAVVCAQDPFCCKTKWDSACVNECIAALGGAAPKCPKVSCGDGSCSAGETCSGCPKDCGECPPTCGDSKCNGTETADSCPKDCGVGCKGLCNDYSKNKTGGMCSCKANCSANGFPPCCDDSAAMCPPKCGDGFCNGTETKESCAEDCAGHFCDKNCGGQGNGCYCDATCKSAGDCCDASGSKVAGKSCAGSTCANCK